MGSGEAGLGLSLSLGSGEGALASSILHQSWVAREEVVEPMLMSQPPDLTQAWRAV